MSNLFDHSIPFIMEGQVVAVDDSDQNGGVKVWVPALDGETFDISSLPWADYASPLAGFTIDYPAGGVPVANSSRVAYGIWATPKIGATVAVFCLNGDPARRFYFACTYRLHANRSLPAGRNADDAGTPGPFGDDKDASGLFTHVQPAYDNLRAQFQDNVNASQAKTRGAYERQVAQAKDLKDGTEGYKKTPVTGEKYLDSQTQCWVTPGRHALIFQDNPENSRVRVKTAEGSQIIFDDANERIYVSTARGKSWIELDFDGHVHVFGAESMSFRSGGDLNFYADKNIFMEAGKAIHMKATGGDVRISTKTDFHLESGGSILASACTNMDLNANAKFTISSTTCNINGPAAACPSSAESPTIVPGHEPWTRPASSTTRGQYWKE